MELALLGAIRWWASALAVLFTIVCIVLIIIVLLQKGRGGGLSAAFGGAGGHSAFGSKTGDVFTWATIVIVGLFLLLAMILTRTYKPYTAEEELSLPALQQQPGTTGAIPPPGAGAPAPTQTPPTGASKNPLDKNPPTVPDKSGADPDKNKQK